MAALAVRTSHHPSHDHGAEKTNSYEAGQKEEESLWSPSTYEPVTAFTALLAIIAGLQGFLFLWQLRLIKVGAADAELAANAARDSADATKASVETMKDNAVRQLRAYVLPSEAGVTTVNNIISVRVQLKNFGQTPAYHCALAINYYVGKYPFDIGDVPIISDDLAGEASRDTMAPTRISDIVKAVAILQPDIILIAAGLKAVWAVGSITYTDAFKKPRTTNIRLLCRGDYWSAGIMFADTEGNESD